MKYLLLLLLIPIIALAVNTASLDVDRTGNKYATAADSASLSVTGDLTIEFWMNMQTCNNAGASYAFVSKEGSYKISAPTGSPTCDSGEGYTIDIGATQVGGTYDWFDVGTWNHWANVYIASAGTVDVYKNGAFVFQRTGFPTSIPDNGNTFCIDNSGTTCAANDGVDMLIDDVRIWSVARTATQISANYNCELTGSEANLNAYWKLNSSELDETVNNNDLTLVNTPTYNTASLWLESCPSAAPPIINRPGVIFFDADE